MPKKTTPRKSARSKNAKNGDTIVRGAISQKPSQGRGVWRFEFAYVGILGAALFFGLSLTPSLLPRGVLFQSVLSGVAAGLGYGLGLLIQIIWLYLDLPRPSTKTLNRINGWVVATVGLVVGAALWKFVGWQNEIRSAVELGDRLSPLILLPILLLSVAVAFLLLAAARGIQKIFRFVFGWVSRVLSRRAAALISVVVSIVFTFTLVNGVLIGGAFRIANQVFSMRDATIQSDLPRPELATYSGSPDSLSSWDTLGRQGRKFVSTGPSVKQLEAYSGRPATQPVRAYVGLRAADDIQAQADLALRELKRSGAFDRGTLVIASTTGTGWLDPQAVDTLEYVQNGNTAIVGVQYSYLPSWISMFADQARVKQTSDIVFSTIHRYWRTLPADDRPKLYVYGLSLGSYGAENIFETIDIVNEPINGAVLSGPTLYNNVRNSIIANRDLGSPAWQPIYDEGRTVRFTSKRNALGDAKAPWQDVRIVYTANASDPVGFFSFDLALRQPDWLSGERGPDIIPSMRWIPLVTFWQVAADLPSAGGVPSGHGHTYGKSIMVDAWAAVTQPEGWTVQDSERLKKHLR